MKRSRKYGPMGGSHVPGKPPEPSTPSHPASYGVQPGQYGQQDGGEEPGGDTGQMAGGGLTERASQASRFEQTAGGYGTQRQPGQRHYPEPQPKSPAPGRPYEHDQKPASDSGDCRFWELPAGVPQKWGQQEQHPRSASGGCQFGQEPNGGPIVWGQHPQHPVLLP